jgi:hypothetical protein
MSARRKDLELEGERTAQKQYLKVLHEQAGQPSPYQGPRNSLWIGTGLPRKRKVGTGQLVGRVALVRPDDEVLDGGSDFYIGETYANVNGINVFGWSNPIACTFYRGTDHHDFCDDVAVVRAFRTQNGQIVDYVDEVVRDDAPAEPFRKRGLVIPAPPSRPKPPLSSPPIDRSEPPVPPVSESDGESETLGQSQEDPRSPRLNSRDRADHLPAVRAESLLRAQLLAPRTKSLAPVLSTLQSDQYELVTLPAMDCTIIEGQPGTGKTIVASHRAAYLVNEETPPENALDGNVLLVGPTVGYSRHVREVVSRLAGPSDRIQVLSLHELTDLIIGGQKAPYGGSSRTYQDVGWELGRFARSAINKLKALKGSVPRPEAAYEYLRTNAGSITRDRDWSRYLRQLPPYKQALTYRVHAPLVAFIKWEISKPRDLTFVEHVIVDEAQDVTPLEWLLLDEINEADAWTILGDLNQRRSDHTLASWAQVLDVIAIDPETPIRQMKRGYRSTKPILEFANRLLPRNQRTLFAFQESGPVPAVRKARPKELGESVVREIERLLTAHSTGTVAAISPSREVVTIALRAKGWANALRSPSVWELRGKEVTVAVPDEARGLEFDAVVVVEPADFPSNYGRQGPLYTALTRPNRELSVVHAKALPDALRNRQFR